MDHVRALNDDDAAFERWYGPWTPLDPAGVAAALAGVTAAWWIVGGWAIDAFTGRHRDHHDVDVGFLRDDLPAVHAALSPTLCVWSASSGSLRPLIAPEDLEPDCRQLWVRRDGASPWLMDLALTLGDEATWISPRDGSVRVPLEKAVVTAADGIRYLRPELVLGFKSRHHRPQDEADFEAVLPLLDEAGRRWLFDMIEPSQPADPWLRRLRSDGRRGTDPSPEV